MNNNDQNNPLYLYFVNKLSDHAHTINSIFATRPEKMPTLTTKLLRDGGEDYS